MYSQFPKLYTKSIREKYKTLVIEEYLHKEKEEKRNWIDLIGKSFIERPMIFNEEINFPSPIKFNFILNKEYSRIPDLNIFFPDVNFSRPQLLVSEKFLGVLKKFKLFGAQVWPASITAKNETRKDFISLSS